MTYIADYIYFIKKNTYFKGNIVNHNSIIYLKRTMFLLNLFKCNYCST